MTMACRPRRAPRRPAILVAMAALLLASLAAAGCGEPADAPAAVTRAVIQDLAAQEYGRASSRYRRYEDRVLSVEAAATWRQALQHEDPTVREWAIDALSRIGDAEDFERVVPFLEDGFRDVRETAVEALIRLDRDAARVVLVERTSSADPEQVVGAARGLVELGGIDAAPAIIARFEDRRLPAATRAALADLLARLGAVTAVDPLAQVAGDADEDLSLRRLAAESLASLEGAAARAALAGLGDSDDEYIRDLVERMLDDGA